MQRLAVQWKWNGETSREWIQIAHVCSGWFQHLVTGAMNKGVREADSNCIGMHTSARGGFNSGGKDRFVGRDGFKLRWNEHVCSRWVQLRWNAQICWVRRIQIALE